VQQRTPDPSRPAERSIARTVQIAGGLLAVALVAFWAFGLWSRMADARGPTDHTQAAADGTPRLAENPASAAAGFDPGHVYVLGDSLTAMAYNAHGVGKGAPADLTMDAWPGWSATEAQPSLDAAVMTRKIDTLVVALGTNDSTFAWGKEGWNAADVERFQHIITTPPPATCVVVVLPGYSADIEASHASEMDAARADLTRLAQERRSDPANGPTVVIDWQTQVTARPELMGPDGIHLVNDPAIPWPTAEAAAARIGLYWHGVAGCAGR
jgi:hypothetical protein